MFALSVVRVVSLQPPDPEDPGPLDEIPALRTCSRPAGGVAPDRRRRHGNDRTVRESRVRAPPTVIHDFSFLDQRPIIVALAGSNGAGKTSFFHAHLADSGLRFVNADVLAGELGLTAYEAADAAAAIRNALLAGKGSFIFETVLSDPVGDKAAQLRSLADQGYEVVLIFIQIADPRVSIERVSIRVKIGRAHV